MPATFLVDQRRNRADYETTRAILIRIYDDRSRIIKRSLVNMIIITHSRQAIRWYKA